MDLNLVDQIRSTFNALPDYRKQGNNQKYAVGDDLYCHQPFCEAVRQQQMDFLFVCKPDFHALLYEWVADFTCTGEVQVLEKIRWNGKQRLTERYRYINQVPLRDSDDALLVN